MRLSPIALAFAALLASFSAHGGQPAGSPPLNRQPDARPPERAAEDAARDASDMLRFAPLWVPVHMSPRASDVGPPPPAASAVHAMIWQPECQEEIGLSDE